MPRNIKTILRLGIHNLVWVLYYRFTLKTGLIAKVTKIGAPVKGPFFVHSIHHADRSLKSLNLRVFGWLQYSKETPPAWHKSITSNASVKNQNTHWSKISDFDLNVGDIKSVWEISRFDWLLYFSIEYLKTGEEIYLNRLNVWLEDWSKNNPVNQGVNWKCGQETSIRVMHLCLASFLLKQHTNLSQSVIQLLEQHLTRIMPTVLYAMAQDNNHGTSEAVALYVGGLVLEKNTSNRKASKWKKQGRYWITNRVQRLIENDGSFSQYSVNYHRVMLDSLCLAEYFRLLFSEEQFNQKTIKKILLSIEWLNIFTDSVNGRAPNIGANDGALLIPLSSSDYLDYRPTIQLASALFKGKKCYSEQGDYDQPLKLLALNNYEVAPDKINQMDFSEGGYVYIKRNKVRLFMRYPIFHFRPSQCDVLHVDFWLNHNNILRDAGSYSYNTERRWMKYFSGTGAHNTVQFDDQDQMPRISRFLYSDWLNTKACTGLYKQTEFTCFRVGYQDINKFEHFREVRLSDFELSIVDDISGLKDHAIIRWRLIPGDYKISGNSLIADEFKMHIKANVDIKRIELVEGWESQFYMKMTSLPVLEIEVSQSAHIETLITWK